MRELIAFQRTLRYNHAVAFFIVVPREASSTILLIIIELQKTIDQSNKKLIVHYQRYPNIRREIGAENCLSPVISMKPHFDGDQMFSNTLSRLLKNYGFCDPIIAVIACFDIGTFVFPMSHRRALIGYFSLSQYA